MGTKDISFKDVSSISANDADEKLNGKPRRTRKRTLIIFTVVSLVNAGLLILLWSQLLTPARQSTSSTSNIPASNALVGQAAPGFTLSVLSGARGSSVSLAAYKGQPVMLNFWASWCIPCQQEAPFLQSQWQQAHAHGVVFLGVDYEDTKAAGLGFVQQYGVTYPNVMDASGMTAINYGVTGTPETFFINRKGVIVAWEPGPLNEQVFQHDLQLATR
ncbi:MAG TPA: TlpA disulfide reductase family protein [Ktedonobacteraceae bacterium]|nr:TlpA disulfide reductase family protein [Ktedonobacteraceae bacterium]